MEIEETTLQDLIQSWGHADQRQPYCDLWFETNRDKIWVKPITHRYMIQVGNTRLMSTDQPVEVIKGTTVRLDMAQDSCWSVEGIEIRELSKLRSALYKLGGGFIGHKTLARLREV